MNNTSYDKFTDDENYNYDDNDNDDENKYTDSYNFIDYNDLIAVSEYMDNPDLDKITNIINALIKANNILNCIETSFNFDFTFGEYSKWVEIAKIFNENDEINNDYIILIDETSIVCKYTKY